MTKQEVASFVAVKCAPPTSRHCTQLDRQFLNAIRIKPDCLPFVPAAVVTRLKKDGLL